MIYNDFDIISLDPVKYQIASVNVISKAYKKTKVHKLSSNVTAKRGGGVYNTIIRYCIIAFMVLIIFTAINIMGFGEFMENLEQVVNNRNYNFFTHPEFV